MSQKVSWWRNWWIRFYAEKMLIHKKIAEYNLYRHNEAVDNYERKKSTRSMYQTDAEFKGYFIAEEGADLYAMHYNTNWELYIKYKQKLEVLQYVPDEKSAI